MRIVPVIDLQGGQVVRGIAGRRDEYQPIVSRLTSSCRPIDVACAFRDHFALTDLYLADLDAIAGARPALPIYAEVRSLGFRMWVDAGVRRASQAVELAAAGVERVVLGLETIDGPEVLAEACAKLGKERIAFSLDLKAGTPLGDASAWGKPDAGSIAAWAIRTGVRQLLVLDLARVGVGGGTGTEEFCSRLAAQHPNVEIVAGGGVRDGADLDRLRACGVSGVLVASALHDGRLRREDLEMLSPLSPVGRGEKGIKPAIRR